MKLTPRSITFRGNTLVEWRCERHTNNWPLAPQSEAPGRRACAQCEAHTQEIMIQLQRQRAAERRWRENHWRR